MERILGGEERGGSGVKSSGEEPPSQHSSELPVDGGLRKVVGKVCLRN